VGIAKIAIRKVYKMLKTEYTHQILEILVEIAQDSNATDEIRLEAAKLILSHAIDTKEKDNG
jgi:hypothetical protein